MTGSSPGIARRDGRRKIFPAACYVIETIAYRSLVHGAPALDIRKERPMLVRIVIEIRIWGWRLRVTLSGR
jgi:hypothetical protein